MGFQSENLHDRAILGRASAQVFVLLVVDMSVFLILEGIPEHIARVWNPWHSEFIRANGLTADVMSWQVMGP